MYDPLDIRVTDTLSSWKAADIFFFRKHKPSVEEMSYRKRLDCFLSFESKWLVYMDDRRIGEIIMQDVKSVVSF